jgi:alanine-glyoxylate transaminase / serine-glyoxylate transaminase / serine-pyruvate transaminase
MKLRTCSEILVTPGPTMIPDEVLAAMHRPAIDLYSKELEDLTFSCLKDLRSMFSTDGGVYIYASNGHGGWEAALTNVLSKGDTVLLLESGHFAKGWGTMATALGVNVESVPQDCRRAIDLDSVRRALAGDVHHRIKAILAVHVDTGFGVRNDLEGIRRVIDEMRHPALFMVDVIASLGALPFEMDRWGVDVAVGAAQKALMMTPGLAFVAANENAKRLSSSANLRTMYWDWKFRDGPEHYGKFCGTCPEHLIFGLRKSLDLISEEGLTAVHHRHRHLAEATRRAISVWAQEGALSFNVENPEERADSVSVVRLEPESARRLISYCRDVCGVVLGVNIGPLSGQGFRIGHMGNIGISTIFAALAAVESGLLALGIPHGRNGVAAAMSYVAEITAQ